MVAARGAEPQLVDEWIDLDAKRREILSESEELKRRRNESSKRIGELKRQGEDAEALIAEVAELAGRGVVTMEDLAEQAVDDLLEIDGMDAERAGALIMTARAPWFAEEAAD